MADSSKETYPAYPGILGLLQETFLSIDIQDYSPVDVISKVIREEREKYHRCCLFRLANMD